jgi:pSer/pThr/pTyr-binding forkhead associated (FHA) protein
MVRPEGARSPEQFLAQHRATISIVSGPAVGSEYTRGEYVLEWDRVSLGRGPGVDFAIDDSCMSRKHAMLELGGNGFQIRDLGSANGILVNGSSVQIAELKHGDRFELGEHTFEYSVEALAADEERREGERRQNDRRLHSVAVEDERRSGKSRRGGGRRRGRKGGS